jgi:peroxiredoxin Q/BCP
MELLVILISLILAAGETAQPAVTLTAGDIAPDFALMGSDGTTHRLSEITEERTVVIAWFPKAFTGG